MIQEQLTALQITIRNNVISYISKVYNLSEIQIMSSSRHNNIVEARQVAFYLLRKKEHLTYLSIADIFKKHHATILHGVNLIDDYIRIYSHLQNIISNYKPVVFAEFQININLNNDLLAMQSQNSTTNIELVTLTQSIENLINIYNSNRVSL